MAWVTVDNSDFAADGIARRLTFNYPGWITPPPASINDHSLSALGYTVSFKNYAVDFVNHIVTFELTLSSSSNETANPVAQSYGSNTTITGAQSNIKTTFEPITLSVMTVVGIVAAALGLVIVYFTLTKVEKATVDVVSTPQVSLLVIALVIGVAAYALSQVRALKGA
jgi:hypothetical protein